MMEHYGMDRLIEYEVEKIDETVKALNPEYRELESQIRSKNGIFQAEGRVWWVDPGRGDMIKLLEDSHEKFFKHISNKTSITHVFLFTSICPCLYPDNNVLYIFSG